MSASCADAHPVQRPERPKTRETLADYRSRTRTDCPGFRELAKTIEGPLLRILQNLQQAEGWARISEAGLAQLILEDTGILAGESTIRVALKRLAKRGLLHQIHMLKGGIHPKGGEVKVGFRLIRVAMSPAERASFIDRQLRLHKEWKQGRRKTPRETSLGMKVNHAAIYQLMTKVDRSVPAPTSSAEQQRLFDDKRRAEIARARDLAAKFAAEDSS